MSMQHANTQMSDFESISNAPFESSDLWSKDGSVHIYQNWEGRWVRCLIPQGPDDSGREWFFDTLEDAVGLRHPFLLEAELSVSMSKDVRQTRTLVEAREDLLSVMSSWRAGLSVETEMRRAIRRLDHLTEAQV